MASKIYLHQHPKFKYLVRIVAKQLNIDPYLAEKDYWIMHCLHGLQHAKYDFQMKGGTSLSKGYNIIHRFSEDIDIHVTPPEILNLKTSKNHTKAHHVQGRRNYYDLLSAEISIVDIKCSRDHAFDDERKYYSGGIRLSYNNHFDNKGVEAKEGVLLEVGFDDVCPNKPVDISSWAYDFAVKEEKVNILDNRAKGILCYLPGYTFVEKLQAIATKYRRFKEVGKIPANFMRHYYDIYCLLQDEKVQGFAKTKEYVQHKEKRFPAKDREILISKNPAFQLTDQNEYDLFKQEYKAKAALYYRGQPEFDEVINLIRKHAPYL